MNVLIYWEDHYFKILQSTLNKVRSEVAHHCFLTPNTYSKTARGYGQFINVVKTDWPIASIHGIMNPKSHGPIDVLLCIADADRAHECCSQISKPQTGATESWLEDANDKWTQYLRSQTEHLPLRIFGRFLRWSKESVVVSCFDQPPVIEALSKTKPEPGVLDDFLGRCTPDPRITPDHQFVDTYRRPTRCLNDMLKELGHSTPNKNAQEVEDALRAFPRRPASDILERVPDLVDLAQWIGSLHHRIHELIGLDTVDDVYRLMEQSYSQIQERVEDDYLLFGMLALHEDTEPEQRAPAAKLFVHFFSNDRRQDISKVDEQSVFDQLNHSNDDCIVDALLQDS